MNLYWAVNEMLSQQTYELPTIPVPVTLDLLDTSSRSGSIAHRTIVQLDLILRLKTILTIAPICHFYKNHNLSSRELFDTSVVLTRQVSLADTLVRFRPIASGQMST